MDVSRETPHVTTKPTCYDLTNISVPSSLLLQAPLPAEGHAQLGELLQAGRRERTASVVCVCVALHLDKTLDAAPETVVLIFFPGRWVRPTLAT